MAKSYHISVRQQLIDLRNAIIDLPKARQEREKTVRYRDHLTFTLLPPKECTFQSERNVELLQVQFENSILDPYRDTAKKKATEAKERLSESIQVNPKPQKTLKNTLVILFSILSFCLTVGLLVAGGFFTYKVTTWSWQQSIASIQSSHYLWVDNYKFEHAVSIHMLALCLTMIGCGIAIHFIAEAVYDYEGLFIAGKVLIWGIAGISLILSVGYLFSNAGFWMGLLYVLGIVFLILPIAFIPLALIDCILFIVPFLAVPIVTLLAVGYLIYGSVLLIKFTKESIDQRIAQAYQDRSRRIADEYQIVYDREFAKAPVIDYTPFYASKEYKEAVARDKIENENAKIQYTENYHKQLEAHKKLLADYNSAISKLDVIIGQCQITINSATFLPENKQTVSWIDTILWYVNNRGAETVHDALNDYETDLHRRRMEKQLSALRQETEERMKQGVAAITSQLNSVQSEMSRGIASINANVSQQTKEFNQSMASLAAVTRASAQSLIESSNEIARNTAATASNTSDIANHTRSIRDTARMRK